jgi:hypothetical protein
VSVRIPVTLLAAEKLPIFSGRASYRCSSASSSARSMWPSASAGIGTTSAMDSRHGSSLEWCSYGPMKTTGRRSDGIRTLSWNSSSSTEGIRRPRTPISLSIAPVHPEPAKITTVSSSPPTASRMIPRASSRNRVVCRPVPLDSVWVFA